MIVDGGAVPALVRQLQAPPVAEMGGVQVAFEHEMEKGCAFMLGVLAVKVHIVQRGAVHPLIDMLESPDIQIKEMSAFALGWLAQDTHNQAGVVHNDGLMPLLKLLDSKNGSLQHNAAFALYGLADNEDNISDFVKVGGVQKLLDGEFIVQATKDCVAKTLKRIEEKTNGRVLRHLLYLMQTADRFVQRRVSLALAHLCSPEDQRTIFIDNNGDLTQIATCHLKENELVYITGQISGEPPPFNIKLRQTSIQEVLV